MVDWGQAGFMVAVHTEGFSRVARAGALGGEQVPANVRAPGAEASGSGQDRVGYQEGETDLGLYCIELLGNADGRRTLGIRGS